MENLINTKLIKNFIKKNYLTKKAFSNIAKIRLNDLNKLLKNNLNVDAVVLFKIAKVVGVQVYELFVWRFTFRVLVFLLGVRAWLQAGGLDFFRGRLGLCYIAPLGHLLNFFPYF